MEKRKSLTGKKKLWLGIPVVVVLLLAGFCVWYVSDYYHAEPSVNTYLTSGGNVTVTIEKNMIFLDGSGTDTAMIFYPGAKVEYTAYVPLFYALAEQGIDCFVVKMPCNLAMFGLGRAGDIMESYTYENWYFSGHSLGGAMGASYVLDHKEEFEGIVFLASYPTGDLSQSGLSVLSIYGSEDMVLNRENLEAGRGLMPGNYTEVCIEGGNHAWFAYYGEQAGDGVATITKEEQQEQTVEAIMNYIGK